jgi:hypothetical protein
MAVDLAFPCTPPLPSEADPQRRTKMGILDADCFSETHSTVTGGAGSEPTVTVAALGSEGASSQPLTPVAADCLRRTLLVNQGRALEAREPLLESTPPETDKDLEENSFAIAVVVVMKNLYSYQRNFCSVGTLL